MLTRRFGLIVTVALCALTFTGIALSQTTPPLTYSCPKYYELVNSYPADCLYDESWNAFPDPNAPRTLVCCNPGGSPFGLDCKAPRPSCGAPKYAAPETCLSCNRGLTAQAGEPIDLATGNTYIAQVDISVPGLGGGLSLARTWNSLLPASQASYPFMFGTNWRSTYEERLIILNGDGYLKYVRSDGSVWSFALNNIGPNVYKLAAPADDTTTAVTEGSPNWTITLKSGEKRLFDATAGALTSIVDRNGNATVLAYDSANRLATVTDAALRHLYFNYPDNVSSLVSSVTSDFDLSTAYTYDAQGRLTTVTKTDGTTVSFEFNTKSLITTVKDNEGKTLESHTYDALGRGLTSSRANGVQHVTVTYPQ